MQLWLPELDGPVDFQDPAHLAVRLLGAQSKREVLWARFRVLAAMRAQAGQQGRYLGGRPPYGYRLVDAGPHPNGAHAKWGRRLHKLEPADGPAQFSAASPVGAAALTGRSRLIRADPAIRLRLPISASAMTLTASGLAIWLASGYM